MENPSQPQLKIVYRDVLLGYTKISIVKWGKAFIKHLSTFDSVDLDEQTEQWTKIAVDQGVPDRKEQLKYLEKEDLWGKREILELAEAKEFLSNLHLTKRKLFLKSQIDEIKEEMAEPEKKIARLERERKDLMGTTAETWAEKKVNEYYIQSVLFKDKEFKKPLFNEEEYNDLDDKQMSNIVLQYNNTTELFKTRSFKLVALSTFMSNSFYMCDNNPYFFYGKPIIDLTFFQLELFSHAAYFKHIMQDSKAKPPDSVMQNPEELVEWFESSKNAEEVIEKMDTGQAGGSSLVGATSEDLERLGLRNPSGKTLSSEAAKRGGKLSMEDFIDIHGQ